MTGGTHRRAGRWAVVVLLPRVLSACNWTVLHRSLGGSRVDPSGASFSSPHQAWVSPKLSGKLYGEPLVDGSQVLVATEADTVVSLSASTGKSLWQTTLATPVPATGLPCGNISPTVGITSTPVVDMSRQEIFVVADELSGGVVQHHLYGLSVSTGAVLLNQDVDPPASDPKALFQRVA
jgi:outer membrane protein assembly factor BamB